MFLAEFPFSSRYDYISLMYDAKTSTTKLEIIELSDEFDIGGALRGKIIEL